MTKEVIIFMIPLYTLTMDPQVMRETAKDASKKIRGDISKAYNSIISYVGDYLSQKRINNRLYDLGKEEYPEVMPQMREIMKNKKSGEYYKSRLNSINACYRATH